MHNLTRQRTLTDIWRYSYVTAATRPLQLLDQRLSGIFHTMLATLADGYCQDSSLPPISCDIRGMRRDLRGGGNQFT